jgi:3-dehydroquinate synthase
MLTRLDVRLPAPASSERSYPVFLVGDGAVERRFAEELQRRMEAQAGARRRGTARAPRVALLTDETVARLHRGRYQQALADRGIEVVATVVGDGESAKSLATVEAIADSWAGARVDRETWVLALGGGVIGDLGGLLATLYARGLPLVQVPTTLLAQVDASVGGKCAVNLAAGKNLLGSFLQPRFVWADLTTLRTLSARDLCAGLAEVVKHGLLGDPGLLELLEERSGAAASGEPELMAELVARSVVFKARVVAMDERETDSAAPGGGRAQLNLGHTIGHAIESASHHAPSEQGPLRHGEAVALGLLAELRLGAKLGVTEPRLEARIRRLLAGLGLPVEVDGWLRPEVLARVGVDKKGEGATIRLALVERPGVPRLVPIPEAVLFQELLPPPA